MTIEYVHRYEVYAKSMAIPESLKHLLVQALECHLTMVQVMERSACPPFWCVHVFSRHLWPEVLAVGSPLQPTIP